MADMGTRRAERSDRSDVLLVRLARSLPANYIKCLHWCLQALFDALSQIMNVFGTGVQGLLLPCDDV